jgi:hypothetical protein
MELYDELPEEVFYGRAAERWKNDFWVNLHARAICDQILESGEADPVEVERTIEQGGGERGLYTVLRGIDWALEVVNPFAANFAYGKLAGLAARYAGTGILNDQKATRGALLPRCSYLGRPQGRRSKPLHFGVHRVSPSYWQKIQYSRLESRYEPSRFRAGEPVKVGCAPLLETFDDIHLGFGLRDGLSMYRLMPAESSSLCDRISNVIRKLDDQGAGIGMVPEGTLTNKLLEHWEQEAARTAVQGGSLRWILVGSGPLGEGDPPPNRAVLLDRLTGHQIMSQDKRAGFSIEARQIKEWKIPNPPLSVPVAEDIQRGGHIAVRETSLGRLAILICEDLDQSTEWDRELIACGVSHLLVPIFSKPIINFRWEEQACTRTVKDMGAWLVVANSLVVQRAKGAPPKGEQWYTCLVAGPKSTDRSEYDHVMQFAAAEAGDELAVLGEEWLDKAGALPVIHAGQFLASWLGDPRWPTSGR